ncbi:MAG: alpha/beta hydrolase [Pseudomonadota bacterium]
MAQDADPQLQPHLARIAALVANAPGTPLEKRRAASLALSSYVDDNTLPTLRAPRTATKDGAVSARGRRIGTRTYIPEDGPGGDLTLLYFHGGGWVSGNLESHDDLLRRVAHMLGCTLIAVDYRLAPEHAMPAALEDAAEVLGHLRENLKGRPGARFALGGDSSGAHIAAVTANTIAPDAAGLLLFYPVVRPHFTTRSYIERCNSNLTVGMMKWFWEQYLGMGIEGDKLDTPDARIDLLQQKWHRAPPPAVVLTAWHDPLCDEGSAYARHLAEAGGEVRLTCANGMPHGFARFCGINATAERHIAQAVRDFAGLVQADSMASAR